MPNNMPFGFGNMPMNNNFNNDLFSLQSKLYDLEKRVDILEKELNINNNYNNYNHGYNNGYSNNPNTNSYTKFSSNNYDYQTSMNMM